MSHPTPFDYVEYRKNKELEMQARIDATLPTLKALFADYPEVKSVEVEYNGEGDSGELTEVLLEGSAIEEATEDAFRRVAESLVWDLLERDHPGWEINEGSEGKFTITPYGIKWDHGRRTIEVTTRTLEIRL